MKLIYGKINNNFFATFANTSREEKLLLEEFNIATINSKQDVLETLKHERINLTDTESLKLIFSELVYNEIDYSERYTLDEIREKFSLKEDDIIDVEINYIQLNYSQEELLSVMIKNPLENKELNWKSLVTIYDDGENTIECQFEKFSTDTNVYNVSSVMAKINIMSSYYDDNDQERCESRIIGFDIYGSEMIPMNHLICEEIFMEIISNISKITKWKYTFHRFGEPISTIIGDKTILWSK